MVEMCSGISKGGKCLKDHICKGGISMEISHEKEKQICEMFDSFCKTVIPNCSRNLKRDAIIMIFIGGFMIFK